MAPDSERVGPRVPDGSGTNGQRGRYQSTPTSDEGRAYMIDHLPSGGGKMYVREDHDSASVEFPPGTELRVESSGDVGGEANVTVHAEDPRSTEAYGQFSVFLDREQCLGAAQFFAALAENAGDTARDDGDGGSALSALVGRIRREAADDE